MDEHDHSIKILNRRNLQLTGILKADSSTEEKIILKTTMGDMVINGEELHICHLDLESGEAILGGKMDSLSYISPSLRNKAKYQNVKKLTKIFK
ncbi:MAG: YabP/YqfC family sporulation protein [Clostridiales bacterium]